MKKFVFYLPLCALIASLLFQCSIFLIDTARDNENTINEKEHYFREINEIIKDLDFHSAKVKDGKIILYNNKYETTSEILFEDYDKNIKFIGAHKDDNTVCFIISGAVDDEYGIMFVNDDSDSMMDGLWRADRIGGNSYKYSTCRED